MDTLLRAVVTVLLLVTVSASADEPQKLEDVGAWMTYYYLHPRPDQVADALKKIDAEGYFDNPDVQAPLSGFGPVRIFVCEAYHDNRKESVCRGRPRRTP
jgi:hypothetical protein